MKLFARFLAFAGVSLFLVVPESARAQNSPNPFFSGSSGDRVGLSVASAGDVNNDGIPDIIVGADHLHGDQLGKAYIFFGGSPPDSIPDITFTSASLQGFGWSVAGAGDVNGDGFDDVLVAIGGTGSGTEAKYVHLYLGGAPMDSIADVVMTDTIPWFGFSVAGAGDVNNDGYADMLVCAIGANKKALIYFGGASPDSIPDLEFVGRASGISAGDMNQDGFDDIIVGGAYVYFGGAAMDTIPDLTLVAEATDDGLGRSIAGGIDINGDGWLDLVVGAPQNDAGGTNAGRAYVYFGGAALDSIADYVITGSGTGNYLGFNVAALGDLDQDGYDDFSVSSDIALHPISGKKGKVHIFRGGPVITPDIVFEGSGNQDNFGWFVASAGDFNQDATLDMIIGANFAQDTSGLVYFVPGVFTAVEEELSNIPERFALWQNYPNPFNPSTTIRFSLPARAHVTLTVFNLLGQKVATLVDEVQEAGTRSVSFEGSRLASGVYFYRLETGSFMQIRKMLLMK